MHFELHTFVLAAESQPAGLAFAFTFRIENCIFGLTGMSICRFVG